MVKHKILPLALAACMATAPAQAGSLRPPGGSPGDPVSKELKEAILGMHWWNALEEHTSCYIELFGKRVVNGRCILRTAPKVKDVACTGYFTYAEHLKPEFRDEVPNIVVCYNPSIGRFGFQIKDDGDVVDLELLTGKRGGCVGNPSAKICSSEVSLPPF